MKPTAWKRLGSALLTAGLVVAIVALSDPVGRTQWLTKTIGVVVILTALGIVFAPRLIAALNPATPDEIGRAHV